MATQRHEAATSTQGAFRFGPLTIFRASQEYKMTALLERYRAPFAPLLTLITRELGSLLEITLFSSPTRYDKVSTPLHSLKNPNFDDMPMHIPSYRARRTRGTNKLTVNTSIGTSVDTAPIPLDGHPVGIAEQARAQRLRDQKFANQPQHSDLVPQAFCEIAPGLSIGFSAGTYDPQSIQPPRPTRTGEYIPFSHVICIVYPYTHLFGCSGPLGGEIGRVWQTQDDGVSVLTVVVPPPAFVDLLPLKYNLVPGTSFTQVQLLLIRDFLALALPIPHTDDKIPPVAKLGDPDAVHVLITTPGPSVLPPKVDVSVSQGAADVVSAVACYFNFISRKRISFVLHDIHYQFFLDFERDLTFRHNLTPWMFQVGEEFYDALESVAKVSSGEVLGLIRKSPPPFYIPKYI